MSLSNILVPNNYNLYSNSQTLNSVSTQPISGNNTLWINSSNNHLYRDGVDLESGLPPITQTYIFSTPLMLGTYNGLQSIGFDSDGITYMAISASGGSQTGTFICNPLAGPLPVGFKIKSITLIYRVVNTDLTSIVPSFTFAKFNNNAAKTLINIPFTGTLPLEANSTQYIATLTITNPITLTQNDLLHVSLDFSGDLPIIWLYGISTDFSI